MIGLGVDATLLRRNIRLKQRTPNERPLRDVSHLSHSALGKRARWTSGIRINTAATRQPVNVELRRASTGRAESAPVYAKCAAQPRRTKRRAIGRHPATGAKPDDQSAPSRRTLSNKRQRHRLYGQGESWGALGQLNALDSGTRHNATAWRLSVHARVAGLQTR